jgi:hypothetical protein
MLPLIDAGTDCFIQCKSFFKTEERFAINSRCFLTSIELSDLSDSAVVHQVSSCSHTSNYPSAPAFSFIARLITALNTRHCRRNKLRRNFFHGKFFHNSLVLLLRPIMLYSVWCFLNASRQLRLVLPESKELILSSGLLWNRPSTDLRFVFIRSSRKIVVPVRWSHFNCQNPLLMPLS